jgi:membrane protease YdiL (CAAX protease family)
MSNQTTLSKIFSFFLVKIIIGIVVVVGSVFLVEWLGRLLLDKTQLNDDTKNLIIAIADVFAALSSYIFLFRYYEKRRIKELSAASFIKNAFIGFMTGLVLQSLFILVIYVFGKYSIIHINPISFLLPSFATAFTAGFVAEIVIVGILFRFAEETLGTFITLLIFFILFVLMHVNVKDATAVSVVSTAIQAGILIPAAYIFSRNLWIPIFLHFAWDFTEPGIFGGINPSISIDKSLLTSKISGASFITGGQMGPQNSVQSLLLCSVAAFIFLWLAKRKNNFIKPSWKK